MKKNLLLIVAALFFIATTQAQSQYQKGTNNWGSSTWGAASGGPYTGAWTNGNGAEFETTAGTTTVNTTGFSAKSLNFNITNHIIGGTNALTLSTTTPAITVGTASGTFTSDITAPISAASQVQISKGTSGSGTLNLNAANTFTSGFKITNAIRVNGNLNGAYGAGGAGADIVIDASGVRLSNASTAPNNGSNSVLNKVSLNPSNASNFVVSLGSTNPASGTWTTDYQGVISGNADVYLGNDVSTSSTSGGSPTKFSNNANTYTGKTIVSFGTNGVFKCGVDNCFPTSTQFVYGLSGGSSQSYGVLDLNGFNIQIGSLETNAGTTPTLKGITNSAASVKTVTISGSASTTYAAIIGALNTASPTSITGTNNEALTLASTNTGTLTLTGANTYTGATIVNGGTLLVNNANGLASGSAVSVGANGVLGGSGKAAGTLSLSGTLSPGSTGATNAGNFTTGAQTWNNGAKYKLNVVNASGAAGTDWDLTTSTGAIDVSTGSYTIDLTGSAAGFTTVSTYTWDIAIGTSITGFNSANWTISTTNFIPSFTGTFTVQATATKIQLKYTPPVPTLSVLPTGLTGFATITGTASPSQNYTLSGLNLDGTAVTVTAPTNFEVSLDNTNFFPTVTLNNGSPATYAAPTLSNTTIYVRITQTAPTGPVSGNVGNAGGNASNVNVAVTGSVTAAEPTTQASNIVFSNVTPGGFDVSWTVGNGSNHLVVVRPTASANVLPGDGNSYAANLNIASAATTGANNYVVYNGTGNGPITVAGLSGSTSYTVEVYDFNGNGGTENYLTSTATNNPLAQITLTPVYYWNGGSPSAALGITANGGSGTWTIANSWVQPTNPGNGATWVDNNAAELVGAAGTVSIVNGGTVNPTTTTVRTTNYIITSAGTTTSVLGGNIVLDPSVNLVLNDPTQTGNRSLSIGSVSGGAGSGLTIKGNQSSGNNSRVNLATSNATVSVPVTIVGTGAATAYAGIVATATGTSITSNITNNSSQPTVLGATSGNALSISGNITGSQGVIFAAGTSGGAGIVTLSGTNTYSGQTNVNNTASGSIKCGAANTLSPNSVLNLGSTSSNGSPVDLNGFDQVIGGLTNGAGTGSITNTAAGTGTNTLTINQSTNTTYGLTITDGTTRKVAVTKKGTGTIKFTVSNTFTGGLSIDKGTFQLGNGNILDNTLPVTLNGGDLSTGSSSGFNETVGTLSLTDNSTITFATGSHTLHFANSSALGWTPGKTITISNWAGTPNSSGTSGQIFVGNDNTGLTAAQLLQINFVGFNPGAAILNTGEVVPATASLVVDQTGFNGNFGNINVGSISTEQSFTVSGTSLDPTVVITPLAGYEVSLTSGTGFQSTAITLNTTAGILSTTTIYVHFAPTTAGIANGNIPVTSGTTTQNVVVSGTGVISAFYSVASGRAAIDPIWSYIPNGTPQTIASLGGFSPTTDVNIQGGTTVTTSVSQEIKAKDLNVGVGGVLKGLNPGTGFNPYYINVFGDITVDGQLGLANGADSIGLNVEGANCTITGTGAIDLQRIRKSANTNITTNLFINRNVNLWWGATALYNNFSGTSTLNVTVAFGATLNLQGNGDLTIDGTDGTGSGTRTGTITVNGTITGVDTVYASTNNSTGTTGITINANGLLSAKRVMAKLGGTGGFVLNVQNSGKMDVYTALELQSGNFAPSGKVTLKSTSISSIAYLDNFTSGFTGTYTGNISAERFYGTSVSYNEHFMGSPVNSPSFSQFGATGTPGYIVPTTNCDETSIGYGSPYGTVLSLDETHGATCTSAQWKSEIGGSATNAVGYSVAKPGSGVLTLTGAPNLNATYSVSNLNNSSWANGTLQGHGVISGWHLLSNPYPATLNLTTVNAGFDNQVIIWNTSGPFAGSYQTYFVGSNAVIPPFQGFMVHKTSPGAGTYTIKATDRVRTALNFYQTNANELTVVAENTDNNMLDQTVVAFNSNATDQFDPVFDAYKNPGALNRHTLYTTNNNSWMSHNVLRDMVQTNVVPIGFEPGKTGNYKLSFNGVNTFDATAYIFLEDKTLGIMHDVRSGDYVFTADSSDNWSRFVLHFTPAIEVNTTDASCSNNGVITLNQPGATSWNYTITDANDVLVNAGALTAGNLLNVNVPAGTYTLNLIDNNNYSVIKTIQVAGGTPIVAAFNVSANAVGQAENVVFTATTPNAITYTWNFGNGVTEMGQSVTYNYSASGTYNVQLTVTNATGCSSTSSRSITVNSDVTGIKNVSPDNAIAIWSNESVVNVDFNQLKKVEAVITIFNVLGQEISNEKFTNNTIYKKPLNNMEAGFVIVSVKQGSTISTRKLFISNNN